MSKDANEMFGGVDGLLVKGRLVVLAEKLAHVYVLLANTAKGILGEREARVRAWNFVCTGVTLTDHKLWWSWWETSRPQRSTLSRSTLAPWKTKSG
jgi:hypothetical protein